MAPEQFRGQAVFASDIYSLGVTMYQMLTGVLPYDTPAPADLDRLMRGELVSAPRLKNPAIPKAIDDIVIKRAARRTFTPRYQRADELLRRRAGAREAPAAARASAARAAGRGAPATAAADRAREDRATAFLLALPQTVARARARGARSAGETQ